MTRQTTTSIERHEIELYVRRARIERAAAIRRAFRRLIGRQVRETAGTR
jgi:hypothetical protein